jgi:hypothetical protein
MGELRAFRWQVVELCTVGAYLNPSPDTKLIFFENRDRPVEGFEGHQLKIVDGHIVGVYDLRSGGLACGFSPRTGLYMGVANILGPKLPKSRGMLILETLRRATNLVEAKDYIARELFTGNYSPGVFILTDGNTLMRIEGYGSMVASKQSYRYEVATNRVRLLPPDTAAPGSRERERETYRALEGKLLDKKMIVELLSSHSPASICRHGLTLCSIIVIERQGEWELLFADGYPCDGYQEYHLVQRHGQWTLESVGNI